MKKLYILMVALFLVNIALGQNKPCVTCLPQGITFSSQAQIDNFQTNYPNCTQIEGDVTIGVYSGSNITNLNGLSVLTSIGGSFTFGGNPLLVNLSGLNNLTSVGGNFGTMVFNPNSFTFVGNQSLTGLTGLENLTSIGGNLTIGNNEALTSLSGLDNIDAGSIMNLNISNNSSLSTCEVQSVCNYLANPNGVVNIYYNATGCNNPPQVASNCGITLPCLPYGNYHFFSQAEVDNFQSDYPGCTDLNGPVSIMNDDIKNLNGLNVLTSIGGTLEISFTDSLTSLSGLDNLTSIGSNLQIGIFNNALISLSGLEGLTSIGGSLYIGWNAALTSLAGLENIDAGTITDLSITMNSSLSTCHVKSVCDYLAAPNGSILILTNAYGCNSESQVKNRCAVGLDESDTNAKQFYLYPNPASTIITLATPTKGSLSILSFKGQQLLKQEITEPTTTIDVSTLPKGVYLLKVVTEKGVLVGKFMKQ